MFDFLISFIPRAVGQGIPLLYGSTGEIMTEKSGNLNLGIPGVMYVGGIAGVIGAFLYEQGGNVIAPLAILIPLLCSLLGSLIMGLIYCFLTVTLRANQNVTGLAMTTFGVGIGNFFGGTGSLGIDTVNHLDCNNFDNGVYLIEGWEIVGRMYFDGEEQDYYELIKMLRSINDKMPESERITIPDKL